VVVASLTLLVSPPELRKRQSELVELVLRTARGVSGLLSDSLWPEPIGGAGRPGVIRNAPATPARSRP
jgi:hypothetical protein